MIILAEIGRGGLNQAVIGIEETRATLQAAVEATKGFDNDKIKDWLHANEVQTILGPLSWNDKGEPQGDFILAQWQSGKVEVVGPPDVATTDTIVYPKPPWS